MTRARVRLVLTVALACLALALAACTAAGHATPALTGPTRLAVYVGTYTDAGSRGIYRFELDPSSGATTAPVLAGESENPSFLALHPNGRVLYAVNEVASFGGARTGAVSAYAIDPASGKLTPLNQQPSGGVDPCYLAVDRAGRNVLVANYTSGTVSVLPLAADGRLRPPSTVRQQTGTGPNKARQEGPHAHQIVLDAAEAFAFAVDLGADRIFVYRYGAAAGSLEPNDPQAAVLEPGSGPRHLAWEPSGKIAYVINELGCTVTAFRYDAGRGSLDVFQTVTTLPAGFSGPNKAAEIAVSPDGRFLYTSNRGDDSLAVFSIEATSGTLAASGRVPTGGRTPRHFAIDASGLWLLVANQDSDSITFFRLDPTTGRPSPIGRPLVLSKPVCLLLLAPPR
jgi:6-phosphogluconolactonase